MPNQSELQEIKNFVSSKVGKNQLSVSSPKQSLESYFLNIVSDSSKRQETAGAQKGRGVAEYLRAGVAQKTVEPEVTAEEKPLAEQAEVVSPKVSSPAVASEPLKVSSPAVASEPHTDAESPAPEPQLAPENALVVSDETPVSAEVQSRGCLR